MKVCQASKLQAILKSYQAARAVGVKKIKLHDIKPIMRPINITLPLCHQQKVIDVSVKHT